MKRTSKQNKKNKANWMPKEMCHQENPYLRINTKRKNFAAARKP